MKTTDRYDAKLAIWAKHPKVFRQPRMLGVPYFGHRKFSSWDDFNAWKHDLLLEIARRGGVRWTR